MESQILIDYLEPFLAFVGDRPYVKAALVLLLTLVLAKSIAFIISRLLLVLVSRTGTTVDDAVVSILRSPLSWTVILLGLFAALALLKLPQTAMQIGRALVYSVLVLTWSIFAVRFLRILMSAMSVRARPNAMIRPQTLPLFNNAAMVLVLTLSIYLLFQAWNIDMTAWLASAGIIGIAVGFAAKDTLANLFSGVFILADAPYKIGDYIVLESGERGKVTHIGIRSTRILTRDDVEVTIPNSVIGNTRVVNESGGPHTKYRIRVPVGVAYGSDIDQVRQVLMQVAIGNEQVCDDPAPRVRFRRFGNSSLDFELLCWIYDPEFRGREIDALNTRIYKEFINCGIEIPYAKQDVYIKEIPWQRAESKPPSKGL